MGGATHRDPWDKPGAAILQGGKWTNNAHEPTVKGGPIGWGAIKTHCTAMGSVAANRRLNVFVSILF